MKLSAKNQLKGTIKIIREGAVNVEVVVELSPGVEITSIITKSSADQLGLKSGKAVYAVIKASNVMIGTDD